MRGAGCSADEAARDRAPARRRELRRPRFARRASASASISNGCAKAGCGPISRRRSSFDTRHDCDRRRQPRLRPGDRRIRDAARHRQGGEERHRDDRPAQLRASRARRRLGGDGGRRRARCRCISSTRRARSASRRSAAAIAGCRPIRSRSASRSTAAIRSILDVTTSTVAEGKLMVALNKGEQVPEGWIIDRDGAPTTDPEGVLRWRRAAHRRRAQGLGTVDRHRPAGRRRVDRPQLRSRRHRCCATTCCRSTSRPPSTRRTGGSRARRAASSTGSRRRRRCEQGEPVLAPGDVERRTRAERLRDGVPIDDKTLADLLDAAKLGRHRCCASAAAIVER